METEEKNILICTVGMPGSGKSFVSDELVSRGFSFVRFGQITLDEIIKKGLKPNEKNEKEVRERLRKQYGMGAYAILNIPKFDELLKKSNVVGDDLISWTEYKILKEKYGDLMKVIAVYAPPEMRYKRLASRKAENDEKQRFRPFTEEEGKSRDYAEIENIEKGGPIAMADFIIVNTGGKEDVKKRVSEILFSL